LGKNNNHIATTGITVILLNLSLNRYSQLAIKNGMNARNKFQIRKMKCNCLVAITLNTINPKLKKQDAIKSKVNSNR
jgi:hypothetical protein